MRHESNPARQPHASSTARPLFRSPAIPRRVGIGDDPAPTPQWIRRARRCGPDAMQKSRCRGNRNSRRAGVGAAPRRLHLLDQLHGAALGARRSPCTREAGARHRTPRAFALASPGYEVHHVGIALTSMKLERARCRLRDPPTSFVPSPADVLAGPFALRAPSPAIRPRLRWRRDDGSRDGRRVTRARTRTRISGSFRPAARSILEEDMYGEGGGSSAR